MKVILKREWMGRTKGTELDLVDQIANDLIRRGTAKPAETAGFRETFEDRQVKHSPVEK
ncbi:MAG: hypothetical protein Q7J73_06310 [Dehalococcoidales bacterium]|nr:hypothetical protein [Dehalococcoidales bacterium]